MADKVTELIKVKGKFPWQAAFKMIKDPVGFLKQQQKEVGQLYRIDAPIPFVVFSDHNHIRHILQTNWRNYEKGPAYRGFALMLGNGILNSEGEKWKRNRKMIQPGFNRDHINSIAEIMHDSAIEWTERWKNRIEQNRPIEGKHEMIQFSLDVIARVMMGERLSEQYKRKLLPLLQNQYGFVMNRNRSFVNFPLWMPTLKHIKYHKTKDQLHQLVYEIIKAKKKNPDDSLLSMIIQAKDDQGKSMTKEELRDEFLTLFVTGFETTGNALAWTLLLLAKHKDVQDKIVTEINEINTDSEPLISQLMRSKWMNAVIKETLRLYPSVWIIARRSIGEDEIGGKRIPKNAHIFMSNFMAHRNPEYWEDPEAFKPERFIDTKDNPSYLPFGLGARMCIGNHFSHVEMLVALYTFYKNFKIELKKDRGLDIDPKITLQPLGDIQLQLISRQN